MGAGGVLFVSRADVPGGLFTFGGADVANRSRIGAGSLVDANLVITFAGYLGGVLVGTDVFDRPAAYATFSSANLSGVPLDELRVTSPVGTFPLFPGVFTTTANTVVDNIRVTPAAVPEPSSLVLLAGVGLVGLGGRAIRRREAAGRSVIPPK